MMRNGVMTKRPFKIVDMKYNRGRGFWEYLLNDPSTGELYEGGAWVREKDLKSK
tara:strand:- start:7457 stop:7618 length:162 start_codon:yes stop_codon:yes gene_type:complete